MRFLLEEGESSGEIEKLLDLAYREIGLGGYNNSTHSYMTGFNSTPGITPPLPQNRDNEGLVFFTRPMCNLSYGNIRNTRSFANLIDKSEYGMGNAIRCMLNVKGFDKASGRSVLNARDGY